MPLSAVTKAEGAAFNGRFLTQPVSGVQRFARELLNALDERLDADGDLASRFGPVEVLVPRAGEIVDPPRWRALRLRRAGRLGGHLWEQTELPQLLSGRLLTSLCGAGPLVHKRQILVMHDAHIFEMPQAYKWQYRLVHGVARRVHSGRLWQLATVSRHSALELARHLGVPSSRFAVLPNGADHMDRLVEDNGVMATAGLQPNRYFLAVGNLSPIKNIGALIEAHARLPGDAPVLAVVGTRAAGLAAAGLRASPRTVFLGRRSDSELKALYRNASAFVFPSLREGFGIPPVEAMRLGTPVLSSSTTVMPDVLGNAARYFDPGQVDTIHSALVDWLATGAESRAAQIARGRARAERFTWAPTADKLVALMLGTAAAGKERDRCDDRAEANSC